MNTFAPVSRSEWIAKVEADLKGASFDRLRSRTLEGIEIEPLYTAQDVGDASESGLPGVYPYVRGAAPLGGWLIRQEYSDPRPDVVKAQIEDDFRRGVEALWLDAGPRHGCRVLTVADLDAVLGSVDLGATSVCIDGGADTVDKLAEGAGISALNAERLLDALAGMEMVTRSPDGQYANVADVDRFLVKGRRGYAGEWMCFMRGTGVEATFVRPEIEDPMGPWLAAHPLWSVQDGALVTDRSFDDFASAWAFASKVADAAEAAFHHPDITVGWGRVHITLFSHEAGAITDQDRSLAATIDEF